MGALSKFKSKYIGDRAFYRSVLAIAIPTVIQLAVGNFVNLLDNIMVGTLGTEAMSAVSIVNNFVFVYNLAIFGALSAAGIFTAQFFGSREVDNIRYTFRFKLIMNFAVSTAAVLLLLAFSDGLIELFIHDVEDGANLELVRSEAKIYLWIILVGLIPSAIAQAYASTLRETRETLWPMIASVSAIIANFVLNLVFIFGLLGLPAMGVSGAALATTISRGVEIAILVIWTHTHNARAPFIVGVFSSFKVPRDLFFKILIKGLPLLSNELLWSLALTMRSQAYSTRGISAVAATSVAQTVYNVFSILFLAVGQSLAIMVGNKLGEGDKEGARQMSRRMIALSVGAAAFTSVVLFAVSPFLPLLFDVTSEVREIATFMLCVQCIMMPVYAFANGSYFTIRSGGGVLITMLMDSFYMWSVVVPVSLIFSNFTDISIYWLYPICQGADGFKVILGAILLKKYNWAKTVVEQIPAK